MPLYLEDKKAILFKGEHKPVSLYLGDKKVTGYEYTEQTGEYLSVEGTYNDTANVVISGKSEQTHTAQGKNLFDGILEIGGIDAGTGANMTNSSRSRSKNYTTVPSSVSITLSNNFGANQDVNIYEYNTNKAFVKFTNFLLTSSGKTITTQSSTKYIRFANASTNDLTVKYQLELGSTATEYEPFVPNSPSPEYPSEIKSVGDDGGFDLVSCGRNIWDGSLIEGYIRPTDGEELSWAGYYKTDFIPVPPDTDYVITCTKPSSGTTFWGIYYDINKNYISSQNLAPFTPPFSRKTPIGTTYLRITGLTLSMTTLTQIELGSTATPYTPFRGMQTVHIPYTLRSLPDGTRDYIEIDNVAKKAWCQPLLGQGNVSGGGAIYIYNAFADVVRFSLYLATYDGNGTANGDIISSHLPNTKGAFTSNSENIFIHPTSGSTFYMSLAKSRLGITDTDTNEDMIAKCRTWLGLNNIEISYKLAEPPTPIDIDYNEIKTYYPYTQIYTTSEVQPTLEGKIRIQGA